MCGELNYPYSLSPCSYSCNIEQKIIGIVWGQLSLVQFISWKETLIHKSVHSLRRYSIGEFLKLSQRGRQQERLKTMSSNYQL